MRILSICVLLMISLSLSAQKICMADVFAQMPDSILSYISKNNRLDMIDFMKAEMKAEVTNKLEGKTTMLQLDSTYLKIQLNPAVLLEMKLLKPSFALPDSASMVVCMINTFGTNGSESKIEFYSSKWHKLHLEDPLMSIEQKDFLVRPDTMSIERFNDAVSQPDAYLFSASLSKDDESLTLTPSTTLLITEKQKIVNSLITTKKLYWNGNLFK